MKRLRSGKLEPKRAALPEPGGEDADALVARLVAGLLHEVNTPVGALASSTQTLGRILERLERSFEQEKDPGLARQLQLGKALVEVQRRTAERLEETVRSLEHFVDLDRADERPIDLAESIEAALRLLAPKIGPRVCVRTQIPEDTPKVVTSGRGVHRVLLQVLESAVDAVGDAGEIHIEVVPVRRERLVIWIRDSGRGMPSQEVSRLFEPRFGRRGARIGLQLEWATSQKVIRGLGGDIRVESTEGAGTTVALDLPLVGKAVFGQ